MHFSSTSDPYGHQLTTFVLNSYWVLSKTWISQKINTIKYLNGEKIKMDKNQTIVNGFKTPVARVFFWYGNSEPLEKNIYSNSLWNGRRAFFTVQLFFLNIFFFLSYLPPSWDLWFIFFGFGFRSIRIQFFW